MPVVQWEVELPAILERIPRRDVIFLRQGEVDPVFLDTGLGDNQ